ncbi:glycoside hydrolase family 43 protein [Marinilabilia salmonicolor]|uniref:Glycosyl hydrolase family 43 n=1 Tax=Marinilabilia salmonicolor TaxID=989 RepID=A0A368UWR5_9BACT|nr:glycoside hydrolase family 43 protein [Marinilabilia salmonicolor]RCW32525.1 glycosyl hydrolase family 43 [Marinilabilia salmonicolor]
MGRFFLIVFTVALIFSTSGCQSYSGDSEMVFLFSYFTGRGEDGLHWAYSEDGLHWEALNQGRSVLSPQVGKDSLFRDPCVIKGGDGRYHMVWTTGWTDPYIGYASSSDLIHWSAQKTIPVMKHEPTARNSWAPEVFFDKKREAYLIFWATTIPGLHSPIDHGGKEDGYNHRMYYVTTRDFETFSDTRMFYNPDFSVIDCTILEKDGQYYMFLKNENPNPPEKNIRIAIADDPAGPYPLEVSGPVTGDYWAEGPTPLVVGDSVYVYFDKYREHKYGAVRSRDMKYWEDVSAQVSFPDGIRHGTALVVERSVFEKLKKSFE